jgi:dipeptide transport system substrate-binding protein
VTETLFKREAPWVSLAHSVVFMATPEVTGFKIDPLGRHP